MLWLLNGGRSHNPAAATATSFSQTLIKPASKLKLYKSNQWKTITFAYRVVPLAAWQLLAAPGCSGLIVGAASCSGT